MVQQTPEGFNRKQEQEEDDRCAMYLQMHPEPSLSPEDLRGVELQITDFREMLLVFEGKYSLEDLHAIVDLSPKDAPLHPLREPARRDLIPIVEKLNVLKGILGEESYEYRELYKKYLLLSSAVGYSRGAIIVHDYRYP